MKGQEKERSGQENWEYGPEKEGGGQETDYFHEKREMI